MKNERMKNERINEGKWVWGGINVVFLNLKMTLYNNFPKSQKCL